MKNCSERSELSQKEENDLRLCIAETEKEVRFYKTL